MTSAIRHETVAKLDRTGSPTGGAMIAAVTFLFRMTVNTCVCKLYSSWNAAASTGVQLGSGKSHIERVPLPQSAPRSRPAQGTFCTHPFNTGAAAVQAKTEPTLGRNTYCRFFLFSFPLLKHAGFTDAHGAQPSKPRLPGEPHDSSVHPCRLILDRATTIS